MSDFYILDGHRPIKTNLETWARWIEGADPHRRVVETYVDDICVSTVFLGLDHSFNHGPPMIFETMIFGGEHDEKQWRYSTWDEAVAGHDRAVRLVRGK